MIKANGWLMIDRYKEERVKYEAYTERITKEKVELAKVKVDDFDVKILKLVSNLRICTSNQIIDMMFDERPVSRKNCSNRLKKLYALGCIDRFFPITESGQGTAPVHVVLGPVGGRILEFNSFRRIQILNQGWRHTVAINEVISKMAKEYEVYNIEKPLHWDDSKLIPDIRFKNKDVIVYVEVDMGTEHISMLKNKCENYLDYRDWSGEKFEVLFVFKEEKQKTKLDNFIPKLFNNKFFMTTTFDRLI